MLPAYDNNKLINVQWVHSSISTMQTTAVAPEVFVHMNPHVDYDMHVLVLHSAKLLQFVTSAQVVG